MTIAGRYEEPLDRSSGQSIPNLTVTVYGRGLAHTVGNKSSLYSDLALTTPLANPLPTGVAAHQPGIDVLGNMTFYAAAGDIYEAAATGFTTWLINVPPDGTAVAADAAALAQEVANSVHLTGAETITGLKSYDEVARHKTGENIDVTHPSFGADPTGVADSHDAVIAALNWWQGTPNARGSYIFFPPASSGTTKYHFASAVDLSTYNYACFKGGGGAGGRTPAAQIEGGGSNKLFTGSSVNNLTFENLYFGRNTPTLLHFIDMRGGRFINCSFDPVHTGSADNTGLLLESGFEQFYEGCNFNVTSGGHPSMIWRGINHPDATTVYMQYLRYCQFNYAGIAMQQNTPVTTATGVYSIEHCWSENFPNASGDLISFSTNQAGVQVIGNVYVKDFGHYDPTGGSNYPTLITVNQNVHLESVELDRIGQVGNATRPVIRMDATNNGIVKWVTYRNPITSTPVALDFAGAKVDVVGSSVSIGGATDGIEHAAFTTDVPWRVRRHNEAYNRAQFTGAGVLGFGDGTGAVDTTLGRDASGLTTNKAVAVGTALTVGDGFVSPHLTAMRPNAYIAESISRSGNLTAFAAPQNGKEAVVAIYLKKGQIISTATFWATSASAGITNLWYTLRDSSLNLLKVTNDDTTTGWTNGTAKTLTYVSTYTVPAAGLFYVGIMVASGTSVPTVECNGNGALAALMNTAPALCGFDNTHTGLTTPATAPATLTLNSGVAQMMYAGLA